MNEAPKIRTIEWEMLDKKKFFPLSMASSFTVRTALYPLTLIKTRLQVFPKIWKAFKKFEVPSSSNVIKHHSQYWPRFKGAQRSTRGLLMPFVK